MNPNASEVPLRDVIWFDTFLSSVFHFTRLHDVWLSLLFKNLKQITS